MKTDEKLNKLVIVGNGFDLAHGLKTSYNDFILWYLNKCFDEICEATAYKDELLQLENTHKTNLKTRLGIERINQIKDFEMLEERKWLKVSFSNFLGSLISKSIENDLKWIDIEGEYYQDIVRIYENAISQKMLKRVDAYLPNIVRLNEEFLIITNKLEEYLLSIDCNKVNQDINNLFQQRYINGYHKEQEHFKKILFLNFNYTNTIEKYVVSNDLNYELNYIHGQLNNPKNSIIFGYGDEVDGYYKKFEELNINEFLTHFKSFGYFKTDNYQKLLSFINSEKFDVEILGHSCGLSDRVMLSTIFEHDHCNSIKIHYYQKNQTENDFIFKTQEISRHFKDKAKLRARIIDFSNSKPLTPYKP